MNPECQTSQQVGELYAEHSSWLTGWIYSCLGCHESLAHIEEEFVPSAEHSASMIELLCELRC